MVFQQRHDDQVLPDGLHLLRGQLGHDVTGVDREQRAGAVVCHEEGLVAGNGSLSMLKFSCLQISYPIEPKQKKLLKNLMLEILINLNKLKIISNNFELFYAILNNFKHF